MIFFSLAIVMVVKGSAGKKGRGLKFHLEDDSLFLFPS